MSSSLKNLPIGVQTFEKLILGNYLYVDKTQYFYELIQTETPYFLSRPRRFGKSLMISTLEAIFLGKSALFKGLWIELSDYKWAVHPVIRLDFSGLERKVGPDLSNGIKAMLVDIAVAYEVSLNDSDTIGRVLEKLIVGLANKTGQKVVILVDEYDAPMLDHVGNLEYAQTNRN